MYNMKSVRLFRATFSHYISIDNLKKIALTLEENQLFLWWAMWPMEVCVLDSMFSF